MILGHPSFSVQPTGAAIQNNSMFFHIQQGKILMETIDDSYRLPRWEQVKPLLPPDFQPFEIAHTDEQIIVSAFPHSDFLIAESDILHYVDFQIFRSLAQETAGLMTSCKHLWDWYSANRFCGLCAGHMKPDEKERALRCSECNRLLFPVIAPAVIVAITCGDRILLARNIRYQHFALIAGFVEVGESLEHALKREVKEEVGLDIWDIRYLGDQPWGVSGSHMFAFHAHADDQQEIQIQKNELADARWFSRGEMQPIPHKVSIAYEMMARFQNGTL